MKTKNPTMPKAFLFAFVALLLFSTPAYADGGIPIIFLLNTYALIAGSLWVILSEYGYLKLVFKDIKELSVFRTVIIANTVTAILGIIVIPIAFLIAGQDPLIYAVSRKQPPFPMETLFAADFVISFVMTVIVEYFVLAGAFLNHGVSKKRLFKHTLFMNIISYAGLILLVLGTIVFLSHRQQLPKL